MSKGRLQHHTPIYADTEGRFGLPYHLEMIKDRERVGQICAALKETLKPDDTHCELGAGTAIFSIYAARRCKKVYAVEQDPTMIEFAEEQIARAGLQNKIELIHEDAFHFRPPQKTNSILTEMMSIWCINEPQVPVMNHALQHVLKPGGKTIPQRIVNLLELAHYDYHTLDVNLKASIAQFSGITAPRIMSCSQVFNEYDFSCQNPEHISKKISLTTLLSGPVNCIRLSSLIQFSPKVTFFSTDSLMPQTIVPLPETIHTQKGDQIKLQIEFSTRSSVEDMNIHITP